MYGKKGPDPLWSLLLRFLQPAFLPDLETAVYYISADFQDKNT